MADTLGHSPDRSASTNRNSSAAFSVLVLALAPQIFELLWSIGTVFGASGRGPLQVLAGHGARGTTARHYEHLSPSYLRAAIDEVDAYFAELEKLAPAIKGPQTTVRATMKATCSG